MTLRFVLNWIYSFFEGNWILAQCTGKKPHPRSAHSLTTVDGNQAILIGGFNSLEEALNDAFLFVFSSLVMGCLWLLDIIIYFGRSGLK